MDNLVGLAVPASSAFIKKFFGAWARITRAETTDDVLLTSSSQTFNFGHYFFTLSFKQVIHCFDVTVIAAMSRPQRITFSTRFSNRYRSDEVLVEGELCVEYLGPACN